MQRLSTIWLDLHVLYCNCNKQNSLDLFGFITQVRAYRGEKVTKMKHFNNHRVLECLTLMQSKDSLGDRAMQQTGQLLIHFNHQGHQSDFALTLHIHHA